MEQTSNSFLETERIGKLMQKYSIPCIISLLVGVYSGRTAEEICADDFSFVEQLGLKENLSPTRANGLVSMIETIRRKAEEYCDNGK